METGGILSQKASKSWSFQVGNLDITKMKIQRTCQGRDNAILR
jgi:hypothetical protein